MSVLSLTLQIITRLLWPLEADGTVDAETRQRLAKKAFEQTAAYDQMIADWLTQQTQKTKPEQAEHRLNLSAQKMLDLRYGCLLYTSDAADE